MFFCKNLSHFSFSSLKEQNKLFLLTYKFIADVYYKRSLAFSCFSFITLYLVPLRSSHNSLIEGFEKVHKAKILGGSQFPMEKAFIFFENLDKASIEEFVKKVDFLRFFSFFPYFPYRTLITKEAW